MKWNFNQGAVTPLLCQHWQEFHRLMLAEWKEHPKSKSTFSALKRILVFWLCDWQTTRVVNSWEIPSVFVPSTQQGAPKTMQTVGSGLTRHSGLGQENSRKDICLFNILCKTDDELFYQTKPGISGSFTASRRTSILQSNPTDHYSPAIMFVSEYSAYIHVIGILLKYVQTEHAVLKMGELFTQSDGYFCCAWTASSRLESPAKELVGN